MFRSIISSIGTMPMTDVTSITFDLHDRTNNQVLMFDMFINAINVESLGNFIFLKSKS